MPISFSIIIPTRHRSHQLTQTLSCLQKVQYPTDSFEVIVVDNGSDPKTPLLVKGVKRTFPQLSYLKEKKQGASFARNAGASRAKHNHLIFIDDDVLVGRDFLKGYQASWNTYSDAKVLGGGIQASLETEKSFSCEQQVLLAKHGWCFSHLEWGASDRRLQAGEMVYSANMSYRRSANERNIFSDRLGVQFAGEEMLGAEDYFLCRRLELVGEHLYFVADPRVQVKHLISEHRFSREYISRRHCLAGTEMHITDELLKEIDPDYHSLYLRRCWSIMGLIELLTQPMQRLMLKCYLRSLRDSKSLTAMDTPKKSP